MGELAAEQYRATEAQYELRQARASADVNAQSLHAELARVTLEFDQSSARRANASGGRAAGDEAVAGLQSQVRCSRQKLCV